MLPVMRGPGNTPLTRTAAREKPSGETSAFEIVMSATGPIAPATRRVYESERAMSPAKDWNLLILRQRAKGKATARENWRGCETPS